MTFSHYVGNLAAYFERWSRGARDQDGQRHYPAPAHQFTASEREAISQCPVGEAGRACRAEIMRGRK